MALMGVLVLLCGSLLELIIPVLAQCFVQPLTQHIGAGAPEHPKVRATAATSNLLKLQPAPRENFQSHLKRNGLLKPATGTGWETLGVYQWEMGISLVCQSLTLHFPCC